MKSTPKKKGRPVAVHTCRNGERIVGLFRLADGRWRASGPEKFTFTEPDESLAVARFRNWQASQKQATVAIPAASAHIDDIDAVRKAVLSIDTTPTAPRPHDLRGNIQPPGGPAPTTIPPGRPIIIELNDDRLEFFTNDPVSEAYLWSWFRRNIIERPKWVAERVGIEQLGYLSDLKAPTVSPTLDQVGDLYFDKTKVTDHWRVKCRKFWREFVEAVAVPTLRDVTQEAIADYKASVLEASDAPTYAKHRFGAIKTIIAYSKEWGKWSEDRTRALGYCSILIPPTSTSLDPSPIPPADFQKLLAAADDQMRAILLLALNACLYAQDVADLKPADLDLERGVLIADRGKTGVARVAVLWPDTVEAIRKVSAKGDILFRTGSTRQAHNANTIRKAFRDLRAAAGVDKSIQFACIRDGAYSAACEGDGVQFDHARILAGHRNGIADHYVKRRPQLVGPACRAIAEAYGIK